MGTLDRLRELRERTVARAVVALERALQLDPQMVGPEGGHQPPQRRLVVDAVIGAPAQADEAARELLQRLQRHRRRRLARITVVHMGARDDPAQVAPARRVLDQQRDVPARPPRSISTPWIARRPSGSAACANSIDPETPLWSTTAIASCPSSAAAAASSAGEEAPSRNEKAVWAWSSTYGTNTCSHPVRTDAYICSHPMTRALLQNDAMGRQAYEDMNPHWQASTGPIADAMN